MKQFAEDSFKNSVCKLVDKGEQNTQALSQKGPLRALDAKCCESK